MKSYRYTYISLFDFLPIVVTTEFQVKFPVLYSRFSLVIYFIHSSVYMSIPNSQFIHPSFPLDIHMSRPNLPVTPGISWLPTFESQSPMMKRTSFFVLVLEGLIVFHGTMDCSLPGSSVHGILQARIPEWVAISFYRGSSQPRNWTWVSYICKKILY